MCCFYNAKKIQQGGRMRKVAFLTAAALLASSSVVWAGAKDQSSNTLIDIDATGIIDNTTAKTKVKAKGCTVQVQAKEVNLADDEIVICLAAADVVNPPAGNTVVLTGEVAKGQLKMKVPLGEATFASAGCGTLESLTYNSSLECYKDDPTYRSDGTGPGTWRDACTNGGSGGMIPSPDGPGATKLKVNSTQSVVVGLCEGFSVGDRILPPASQRFLVQGMRAAAVAP
jgi:hypothetical protein